MANASAGFWNRIADKYARRPVADETSYQVKLKTTQEYFTQDMSVLEFACGTGSTAIIHAPHVKQFHATDISERMIEIARDKAEAAGIENISFEVAAIDQLSIEQGSMDAVLGMSILHLLEDRDAVIRQVYRMLKPGGLFVSSTVCLGGRLWWFRWLAPILRGLRLIPLVKFFTPEDLKQSMADAGFSLVHEWQPDPGKALFLIVRKPERVDQ